METFAKVAAAVLVAVVLIQVLAKRDKDISVALSVAVCCIVVSAAGGYLEPVIEFVKKIQSAANLDSEILSVLLKSVGIGLLTEIASLICSDTGNSALGKALQILGVTVILWLSIPLFTALLELVVEVLGET